MTVQELIERLQECDPDAEVRIMSQEGWPFENAIRGLVTRDEVDGEERCQCDHRFAEPHEDGCPADDEPEYPGGTEARDVFIVEGRQERYGSKAAWNLV